MLEHALLVVASHLPQRSVAAAYNPLVIVGPAGAGKSRLMAEVFAHHSLVDQQPAAPTPATGSATLMWDGRSLGLEIAAALSHDTIDRLHDRFVSAHLIIIDGVDQVTAWDSQRALTHLFDAASAAGTAFMMTLRMNPIRCTALDPALASRLSGGLVVSMPPVGTIRCRAAHDAVGGPRGPSLRRVINATARHHGLAAADLIGPSRRRQVAHVRALAMYLARTLTPASLLKIGTAFGGRDHTTVMHGIRMTQQRQSRDPGLAAEIEGLVQRVLRP